MDDATFKIIWTVYFESGVSPFFKKMRYHVIYA